MIGTPTSLVITTLGRFAIYRDHQQLSGGNWNRRKVRELFQLLISADQHHLHREQIQEILWPSSTSEQAANSFGKTLYLLRRALEPELITGKGGNVSTYIALDHDTVILVPGSMEIDADLFENAVKELQGRVRSHVTKKDREADVALMEEFERTLHIYSGDYLLENLYEEWTHKRRDRLRRLYCWLLENAATLALANCMGQQACDYLLKLLEYDPTDEQTHSQLMSVYARMGRRSDALNQFHQLREILRTELRTAPLAETVSLYRDIQRGHVTADLVLPYSSPEQVHHTSSAEAPGSQDNSNVPASVSARIETAQDRYHSPAAIEVELPKEGEAKEGEAQAEQLFPEEVRPERVLQAILVGRTEELAVLQRAFTRARQGQRGVCFISGEPGIGKTRLASDFTLRAEQMQRAQVLWGYCQETNGLLPYQPIVDIIETHARLCDAQRLRHLLGNSAVDLAKIVPEIRTWLPDLPGSAPQAPEIDRRNLYNAVAQYFNALATERPLIIVLDDVQWADTATIQLLSYLTAHAITQPAATGPFYILLYRADEVHALHPLRELMATLSRQDRMEEIRLKRLNEEEVQQLLANIAGHPVGTVFTGEIYKHTEGNPFFISQALLSLVQEGKVKKVDGRWQLTVDMAELSLPQSVRMLIERRLVRFSPECRTTLLQAALMGRQFSSELLCQSRNLTEDEVAQHIDDAIQAQILVPLNEMQEDGGRNLLRSYRQDVDLAFTHDKIREVLYQWLNPLRRRSLHRQAAQAIESLYATHLTPYYGRLAYHYQMAENYTQAVDYYLKAAHQAAGVYAFLDAAGHMEKALALLVSDEDRPGRAELLRQLSVDIYLYLGLIEKSIEAGVAACALWRDLGNVVKEAETRLSVAFAFHWEGRESKALEYITYALNCLVHHPQETHLLARAHAQWGMAAVIMGDTPTALEKLARAEELYAQCGSNDPFIEVVVLWSRSWYAFLAGKAQEMLDYALRGAEICRATQRLGWVPMLTYTAAWAYMLMGNIAEGERIARETLEHAQRHNAIGAQAFTFLALAVLAIQASRWQDAQDYGDKALMIARQLQDVDLQSRVLWSRSVCAGWLDEWDRSIREITEALALSQQDGELSMFYPYYLLQASKAYFYAHQIERAQHYLDQAMQLACERRYRQLPALSKRLQGRILLAQMKFDQAQPYFEQSLQELAELDDAVEYARTQEAYGQFYLARKHAGDQQRGQELLAQAQALFQRLGLKG